MATPKFSRFGGKKSALASLTFTGVGDLRAELERLGAEAPRIAAKILYREAEQIMTASKDQVPVDTGALRASGHVQPPVVQEARVTVLLGYGKEYAIFVHEDLDAHHATGNAKYLEKPALEAAKGLEGRLAAALRVELAG